MVEPSNEQHRAMRPYVESGYLDEVTRICKEMTTLDFDTPVARFEAVLR
jgi:hypothetical protein